MAGPILPPELLSHMAVQHAEDHESLQVLLDDIELPPDTLYSELSEWQKSRVRLPQVTLDAVELQMETDNNNNTNNNVTLKWTLSCQSPTIGGFNFSPETTTTTTTVSCTHYLSFTCLALALRYKAPITMVVPNHEDNEMNSFWSLVPLKNQFPLFTTTQTLQTPADRVQENLQKGFEIHKLFGALKLAMERGDTKAILRIRETLDQYDSLVELPTTLPPNTTEYDPWQ